MGWLQARKLISGRFDKFQHAIDHVEFKHNGFLFYGLLVMLSKAGVASAKLEDL
jgi:hypothetical protein